MITIIRTLFFIIFIISLLNKFQNVFLILIIKLNIFINEYHNTFKFLIIFNC
jgi:hypothetical protein